MSLEPSHKKPCFRAGTYPDHDSSGNIGQELMRNIIQDSSSTMSSDSKRSLSQEIGVSVSHEPRDDVGKCDEKFYTTSRVNTEKSLEIFKDFMEDVQSELTSLMQNCTNCWQQIIEKDTALFNSVRQLEEAALSINEGFQHEMDGLLQSVTGLVTNYKI